MKSAWIDGEFENRISVYDQGFLLGLGVFETMGVFAGDLPLFEDHLARLATGARVLGIGFHRPDALRESALELLARESGDDVMRLTLSAGVEGEPTWCMTTRRRDGKLGHRLHPSSFRRHARDPIAGIKSTSYAFHGVARREAVQVGADDAILLAAGDRILETTTANLFFWTEGVLHTPRSDGSFLQGIARDALIRALAVSGLSVEESDSSLAQLGRSDAMFTTNAVRGPLPAALAGGDPGAASSEFVELDHRVVAAWARVTSEPGDRR